MDKLNALPVGLACACLLAWPRAAAAQGCDAMPAVGDFTVEEIAKTPGMSYDIAVAKDLRVFWVERHGSFKVWNPSTRQVAEIRKLEVLSATPGSTRYYGQAETGLQGLVLDPEFEKTHWVYIYYSLPLSKLGSFGSHALGPIERLSRFTLVNNDLQVDPASEKVLLEHKVFAQCCHFGGTLKWGPDGNLWLTTGDNIHYDYSSKNPYQEANAYSDARSTAANSNDLRGKILRIKVRRFPDTETPAPGAGSTYDIPPGNLAEAWATPEKDKVRPEIYNMGHRNPFTLSIHPDPRKLWAAIGEAGGAGAGRGEDEINLVVKPGFAGWPYFNGNNVPYFQGGYSGSANPFANPGAVVNESRHNTGARTLPPAVSALISTGSTPIKMSMECLGVAWGWATFDPSLDSKVKWPAHLHGKLIVSSYGRHEVNVASFDDNGRLTKLERLFPASDHTEDIMRATQGPDGAFYVSRGDNINFGSSSVSRIYKVSYKGPCAPVAVRPDPARMARRLAERPRMAHMGRTEVPLEVGIGGVQAFDMGGRLVWEGRRGDAKGPGSLEIPASVPAGALQLRYLP